MADVPVPSVAMKKAALAALTVEDGPLDANKIILVKDIDYADADLKMANITEADFSGYAAVSAPVWSAPYVDVGGVVKVSAPSHTFLQNAVTITNTIKGWAITDTAKATLLHLCIFETPRVMNAVDAGLTIQPYVPSIL